MVETTSSGSCNCQMRQLIMLTSSHLANYFDCVRAWYIRVDALPLGDPAGFGVIDSDQALEYLAGAVGDTVRLAFKLEELFAIRTTFL